MRILIKADDGPKVWIALPTGLLLNSITARAASWFLRKKDIYIPWEQIAAFARELKQARKRHRGWKLLEVESAQGDRVDIRL